MRRLILAALLPLAGMLALLQGCSKPADCPDVTSVVREAAPAGGPLAEKEFYECKDTARAGLLEQTWCEAKSKFETSPDSGNPDAFSGYLKGYRNGINDARQGKESRLAPHSVESKSEAPEDTGYRDGYASVKGALGMIEYDCRSAESPSEFKDRWCEASDSFRNSGIGGESPFVKGRYIDGYMSGGRIALTVPTSMEAFFGGENPEGKQPAIAQPGGDLKGAEQGFYRGFDEGYKAMIASIRESINQVMQQMQVPNNMELPEGMMPQQPGQ